MVQEALRSVRGAFDLPTVLALVGISSLAVAASYFHPAGPFIVVGVFATLAAVLEARARSKT